MKFQPFRNSVLRRSNKIVDPCSCMPTCGIITISYGTTLIQRIPNRPARTASVRTKCRTNVQSLRWFYIYSSPDIRYGVLFHIKFSEKQ